MPAHSLGRTMSFRTILTNLNETANNEAVIATAATLAREFEARVTGLYVVPAAPVYPAARYEPIPEMFETHREFFRRQSASVEAAFRAGFPEGSARHRLRIDKSASPLIADSVIESGRCYDLILLSKTDTKSELGVELDFVPRIAVAAGRPVMVVPFKKPMTSVPETVVIGWNGSREAARALFDSLPILQRAKTIHVIWVDPPAERSRSETSPGEGIADALNLHGIKVVVTPVAGSDKTAGEILLQKAADAGAGLLVIGAYGHSRLSEFILGGVTRTVLRDMKCSVLLSH
ncbi:universal stress protein [Taklimakanibacter deserti]|uniref:universal stress protein n=1 Tax=Taklimakanibacter deserti TaxID=2267839 RepID=UPI000E65E9C1